MTHNLLRKKRRFFVLWFLISFFAISIITTSFLVMFLSQSNSLKQVEARTSEENTLAAITYFVSYKINRLTSDLEFMSDILRDHYPTDNNFSEIQAIWLAYSNRRTVYDQIRYIDMEGNEIIRINYDPAGAYIVPADELQNQAHRYYFQDTIGLEKNEIFISQLDLNIESNQIQQPIKPMIRLATPFFNASGKKAGMVVLNYSASDILKQIQTIASSNIGNVSLLNHDGYWLYNQAEPQKEWAFMYDPESSVTFASEYPEVWSAIQSNTAGTVQTKYGLFSYTRLLSDTMFTAESSSCTVLSQVGDWTIVSAIPISSSEGQYFSNQIGDLLLYILQKYYVFYFVFLGISAILATLLTSNMLKKEQVKYYSEYDVMTSSYNRNAGILKLNALYKNLSKNNCITSICFLDVNGLKEVNDVLGHETGDELLVTVANVIRSNIRTNDFMIRFGGDEFVIVFAGVAADTAEQAWERIVKVFDGINQTENRKYVVSVSHGIQEIDCSIDRMLDSILQQADEKMYEEKRRIKSELQVIRK